MANVIVLEVWLMKNIGMGHHVLHQNLLVPHVAFTLSVKQSHKIQDVLVVYATVLK